MDEKKGKDYQKNKYLINISIAVLTAVFVFTVGVFYFSIVKGGVEISDGGVPLGGGADVYNAVFFVDRGVGSSGAVQSSNYLKVGNGYFKRTPAVSLEDVENIQFAGPNCSHLLEDDEIVVWYKIQKVSGRYFVLGYIEVDPHAVKGVKHGVVFATVNDLMESKLAVGSTASTEGYHSPNDGGGAEYEIVESVSKASQKAGMVSLKNGKYAILKLGDTITLKQFGAYGDGSHDDTSALNSAIAVSKGRTLSVPKGTYVISSSIKLPSNFHMVGHGTSSMFFAANGYAPGTDFFVARDQNNIVVESVCFDGNSGYNSRERGHSDADGIHLLDLWNCSNVTISSCTFQNNIYTANRIVGNGTNLTYYRCNYIQVDCGIIVLGNGNLDGLTIQSNYFDGHGNSEPVSLFGKGSARNVLIDDNKMYNKTYGNGVFIGNGAVYENISITNNYMQKTASGIVVSGANNLTISGNTADDTTSGAGIKIVKCSNAEVSGNTVSRTREFGFYVSSCTNLSLHHNLIRDCGYKSKDYFPMDVRGECSNVNIYSNRFQRDDEGLPETFVVCRSTGSVSFSGNEYLKCRMWLGKESSGVTVSEAAVSVRNDSKTNAVTIGVVAETEETETMNHGEVAEEEETAAESEQEEALEEEAAHEEADTTEENTNSEAQNEGEQSGENAGSGEQSGENAGSGEQGGEEAGNHEQGEGNQGETTPVETPPVEEPPVENPPVENPPVEENPGGEDTGTPEEP